MKKLLTLCLIVFATALSAQKSTFRIDKVQDGSLYLVEIVTSLDSTGKALEPKEIPIKFKNEDDLKSAVSGLREKAGAIRMEANKKAGSLEDIANEIMVMLQATDPQPPKKQSKKNGVRKQ